MKRKLITLLAVAGLLLGAVILLYPVVSNIQFRNSQQELIDHYENSVQAIPEKELDAMWDECFEYNENLLDSKVRLTDPFDAEGLDLEEHPYIDLLNQNGDGAMNQVKLNQPILLTKAVKVSIFLKRI